MGTPADKGINSPIWFLPQTIARDIPLQTSSITFKVAVNSTVAQPLTLPLTLTVTVEPAEATGLPISPVQITANNQLITIDLTPHLGDVSVWFTATAVDTNKNTASQVRYMQIRS